MAWSTRMLVAAITAAGMAGGLLATSALADLIKDRQQSMKEQNAMFKPLIEMLKGQRAFDAATAKKAGEDLAAHFERNKTLFPEGSDKGDVETWAKPEIWDDHAAFVKRFDDGITAAKELVAVTDLAGLGAAVGDIGKNVCTACHDRFRRPKK